MIGTTKNLIGAEHDKVISKSIHPILSISRIALKDFLYRYGIIAAKHCQAI